MFSRILTQKSTANYVEQIEQLKQAFQQADAVLVGAGAGLSVSAGMTYSGERFEANFQDFKNQYGIQDMYSGGFYPFGTLEEYWAWWSRHILLNRYEQAPKPVYNRLLDFIQEKDYFVLTTNVDHQFQTAGFDKKRLFYMQGDYGLWQCSKPCCQKTYDNQEMVYQMAAEQKNMKVPAKLVPHCPVCGSPMAMNLRVDDTFVQDEGWYEAQSRYKSFLQQHKGTRMILLELGVGRNTPGIIKYPFWQMTAENPHNIYVCINYGEAFCLKSIEQQAICIDRDIGNVLEMLVE